jgi:hypothetical protein
LLKLEIAIGGHQNFKTRISGNAEQLSVLESSPSALLDGADIMTTDFPGKMTRQLLIE